MYMSLVMVIKEIYIYSVDVVYLQKQIAFLFHICVNF